MITMPGLLGCVLEAVCGYRERGSALEAERAIVESLHGRGALFMIDEVHYLRAGLLDELRSIRDHAGCGLALIGNNGVRMTLERCPQILGRTGMRVDLKHLAERDVAAIAMAGPLGRRLGKAELKVLVRAARGRGGLHTLRRVLTEAWKLSRDGGGGPINAESLAVAAEAVVEQEGHEGEGAGQRAARIRPPPPGLYLPGFDDIFQQLHRRRTAGDPVLPLTHYGDTGREAAYVDGYFGREYDHKTVKHRPALEVVTSAVQMLFHRFDGPNGPIDLDDYLRDDPEMVDLVIGMLFHYDPPTGGTP